MRILESTQAISNPFRIDGTVNLCLTGTVANEWDVESAVLYDDDRVIIPDANLVWISDTGGQPYGADEISVFHSGSPSRAYRLNMGTAGPVATKHDTYTKVFR